MFRSFRTVTQPVYRYNTQVFQIDEAVSVHIGGKMDEGWSPPVARQHHTPDQCSSIPLNLWVGNQGVAKVFWTFSEWLQGRELPYPKHSAPPWAVRKGGLPHQNRCWQGKRKREEASLDKRRACRKSTGPLVSFHAAVSATCLNYLRVLFSFCRMFE